MSDSNVHVTPHAGRWAVDREGSQRVSSVHDTQAEAEAAGRATARREQVEFYLHGRNGQIRERDTLWKRPLPAARLAHCGSIQDWWRPPHILGCAPRGLRKS